MKILKNIFGLKPKQNTKYEPNTLAEMNGSPDMRLATAKEKEVDIPLAKNDEIRKIEKKPTKSNAKNTSTPKSSVSKKAESAEDKADKKSTTKGVSSPASQNSSATKNSTSKPTSDAKENTVKSNVKKASETKKSAPTNAKKAVATAKSSETKSTKSASTKTAVKNTAAKEVKKEVKPAATSKKTAATTEKKVTAEKKAAAPTAKKQTVAKSSAPVATAKTAKSADKPKKAPASKAVESKDTDVITESKATRSGKFEIKKSKDGRFVFNLYASNNVIVATSQVYSSSTSAMNGIKSVISNAASAQIEDQSLKKVTPVPFPKWEIYQDKGEQYRFRLCASNGSCVVHSQGYTSKANCKKGIESIIKFASDAEITKVYLDKK